MFIFFLYTYIKMVNKCYQKTKKSSKKKHVKGTKIFLKKKKKKHRKPWDRYKNLSEEEKQKKVEYMRTYHLAHKKQFLEFYKVVWKLRIPKANFNT